MVEIDAMNDKSSVHVHAPQPDEASISRGLCPDCKRRSAFVNMFTPWYGWSNTCLRCGRTWEDGEWIALPFSRTARSDSITSAKQAYRRFIRPSVQYFNRT